jgi:hypothetical protein
MSALYLIKQVYKRRPPWQARKDKEGEAGQETLLFRGWKVSDVWKLEPLFSYIYQWMNAIRWCVCSHTQLSTFLSLYLQGIFFPNLVSRPYSD